MQEVMSEKTSTVPKPRLKFIDLARAIAIMLMLEGHFVGMVLAKYHRDPEHPVYAAWNFVRGFTAPLFFTVAGMIFIYLLVGETEPDFLKGKRVKKGLKRAAELLLWGYALQLSVAHAASYARLEFEEWVYAFHVLQCIGIGLIALLAIAAVQHRFGKIALAWWYAGAGIAVLAFYIWIGHLPEEEPVPKGWPQIIQNAIHGPRSVFPLAPWLAFAFLGGVIGACVRRFRDKLQTARSCLWFFAFAGLLKALWVIVLILPGLDAVTVDGISWFTGRAAQVVAFLGLLRWVETMWGIAIPRVLCIGTLTFEIYIIHVIVLYGSITGIGLNDWLEEKLNPWQAAGGAAAFLLFFFVLAQGIDAWKSRART